MENQHRKITGYRELNQEEIDLINEIKQKAAELGDLVKRVNDYNTDLSQSVPRYDCYRWAAIAKTDFQTGAMALTRAVTKPEFF